MFWNINKCLSYNALFNFIIGNRGAGKTYGAKKFVISRFLKYGEQFVYLRRYKEELKNIKNFFNDVSVEFPETKFKVKGKELYIDDKLAGYVIPLSTSKIQKSTSYPDVRTIIFDEFIIDTGVYHYLPDEVTYFLEFYETVARMRDVRVLLLSNAMTVGNPYFYYFNIKIPYNNDISCKDDILIEMVNNDEFIETKNKTRFGKLIQGTKYGDYAVNNEFLRDSNTFIEKKSGNCVLLFSFEFQSNIIGVWCNYQANKLYMSYDFDLSRRVYAITTDDLKPNTILISRMKNLQSFQTFALAYKNGLVYYESQKIKKVCEEIYKILQIY